ncbi:MAG: hybrid sensor histidine kinase/response regulator [Spirochaetia bacterium]|nr:hybrid sensor histidine kinase/response regulator [Spirochaetia bacterium]
MKKIEILIVDDKLENLITLEEILDDLPVEIITTQSGNEAVAISLEHEFAIILMDVQMPEMDGFETMKLIRRNELNAYTPVIFLSAIYSDDFYKIKGIEQGAVDFMTKPIAEKILIGKINVFLQMYEQKKTLEQKMKEITMLNRDMQHFSQILAHDLKQPLTGIIGFSELLLTDDKILENEENHSMLELLHSSGKFMLEIIKDAIDLIKTQNEMVVYEPIDADLLIAEIADSFKTNTEHKKLEFQQDKLPRFISSRSLFRSMFRNMIGNSIKYNENDPVKITIHYRLNNGFHEFDISDNGIGIPAEKQKEIFQPFKRANENSKYEGSGIGLSIVQSALEKLDGSIEVKESGASGTTFMMRIADRGGQ